MTRRDQLIKQHCELINEDKKVIRDLERQATESSKQVKELKAKTDRLRHLASYWKSKYVKSSNSSNDEVATVEQECRQKQELL